MGTQMGGCRWLAPARALLAAVAASLTVFALTLVLKKVDAAVPQARDVVLGALGLALILTAGALDGQEPEERELHVEPAEPVSWHEYEGSGRGMVG